MKKKSENDAMSSKNVCLAHSERANINGGCTFSKWTNLLKDAEIP